MRASPLRQLGRALSLAALMLTLPALAEYPSRPLKVIVPSNAGGFTDVLARMLESRLSGMWKQPVVVENKPGASGILAMRALVRAEPDGYTIGFIATPHALLPLVSKSMPYDMLRDATWVATVATTPMLLVAIPSVPAKDAKSALKEAKDHPGKYGYASPGQLSAGHRTMELLKQASGADVRNIPFASGAPALSNMLGGHVEFSAMAVPTLIEHVRAGRLRALGVSSLTRLPLLQDVPTIAESGFPGFESVEWYGVVAPAGTPPDVVARLAADIQTVFRLPAVRDQLTAMGAFATPGGPKELEALFRKETERWQILVPQLGLRLE